MHFENLVLDLDFVELFKIQKEQQRIEVLTVRETQEIITDSSLFNLKYRLCLCIYMSMS